MVSCKPIWAVYKLIFLDLVGGIALLLHGLSMLVRSGYDVESVLAAYSVPSGIMSIVFGSLLWTGVRKGNDVYIFSFLVIRVASLTQFTLTLIVLIIVIETPLGSIFLILIILLIFWCPLYGTYLYYVELVNSIGKSSPGNIVVTYDNIQTNKPNMEEAAV